MATKPVGNARNVPQRNQRVVSSRPRQRRKLPNHETASMISPIPTIRRKPKNGITTGGRSSFGNASSPISFAVQLPEAIMLPSFGISIANRLRLALLVGNRDQHFAGRLLRLPARLDRRELRRLMLEHVEARQVAEEELDRDHHRDEARGPSAASRAPRRDGYCAARTRRRWPPRTCRWSGTRRAACAASAPSSPARARSRASPPG